MLKINQSSLNSMESRYEGILESIKHFEEMQIPPCPRCNSTNTASVQVGVIGRTINLAAATTKFHLVTNGGQAFGKYFCNTCRHYFSPA